MWSLLYLKAIRAPATYKLITGRDIPRREDADMQDVFAIKTKLITAEEDENVLPTPSVKEGNSTS